MPRQTFDDVLVNLDVSPSQAENMRLRSFLMVAINRRVLCWGVTLDEACQRLDLPSQRVIDLTMSRVDQFSLDELTELALRIGVHATRE